MIISVDRPQCASLMMNNQMEEYVSECGTSISNIITFTGVAWEEGNIHTHTRFNINY